jgi:hypothetical protein
VETQPVAGILQIAESADNEVAGDEIAGHGWNEAWPGRGRLAARDCLFTKLAISL